MILSGKEIKKQVDAGNIGIDPFNPDQLNPNSYNLRLADKIVYYDEHILDMKREEPFAEMLIPENGYVILPNKIYLARTVERTKTDKFVPMIEGRSSVGRLGVFVHATAGFGDVGFEGYWTLELSCVQPVVIYPNVEICQIYFHTLEGAYESYGREGKYQNNQGIQTSKIWQEFPKTDTFSVMENYR